MGGWKTIETSVKEHENSKKAMVKALMSIADTNELPAVYNITQDALCTITCPFSSFIPNFSKVSFSAKYARSSLVSYYTGQTAAPTEFTVLWQNVSFATVDDVNEVLLTCSVGGDE